jgi:predicted nuclease of predicted toxin-antitoxin system
MRQRRLMPRILFDENVPEGIRRLLTGHTVETVPELGLARLTNGDLIDAAEKSGFDVMVTADQNLTYQQNLAGRRLALIVLTTNHWDTIRPYAARIVAAVETIKPGGFVTVAFDRPPLRRRPFIP